MPPSDETRRHDYRWGLVGLLSISVFINYLDRGNLSIAAPMLARELSIVPTQLGLLFSAFFWTYALGQIPAGWIVDHFRVERVYAAAYLLWCLATLLTGLAHTIVVLLGLRLLLGLAESVVYPACSQLVVRNFAEHERGRANAIIDVGTKVGPMLSTLVGGLVVAYWGWRTLFLAVGAISMLWLVPWQVWGKGRKDPSPEMIHSGPSMLQIISQRDMLGTSMGLFCYGYVWYFFLTWLPSYLFLERHLSMRAVAFWGAVPFCASGLSALACGWLSDRFIARGASTTRVRKGFIVSGLLLCSVVLPAAIVKSMPLSLTLLTAGFCAIGLFSSNVWAVTQTLAGPVAAGKWSGIQNAAGNLGGVASPLVTGFIVSKTHNFLLAFAAAVVALLAGAGAYTFVVGKIEPLEWKQPREILVDVY